MKQIISLIGLVLLAILLAVPRSIVSAQGPEAGFKPFILGDGALALIYPANWTIDTKKIDQNTIVFVSSPELLSRKGDTPYLAGDVNVSLTLIPLVNISATNISLEKTLTGYIDSLRKGAQDSTGVTRFLPSTANLMPTSVGVPAIAKATFTYVGIEEGAVYFWQISDDLFGLVMVNTAIDEMDRNEVGVLTMIQSVRFNTSVKALLDGTLQKSESSP